MAVYIKNPLYEFIDDEKSVVILEPEMNNIFSVDIIGLKVLEVFDSPTDLELLLSKVEKNFFNINIEELNDLLSWFNRERNDLYESKPCR